MTAKTAKRRGIKGFAFLLCGAFVVMTVLGYRSAHVANERLRDLERRQYHEAQRAAAARSPRFVENADIGSLDLGPSRGDVAYEIVDDHEAAIAALARAVARHVESRRHRGLAAGRVGVTAAHGEDAGLSAGPYDVGRLVQALRPLGINAIEGPALGSTAVDVVFATTADERGDRRYVVRTGSGDAIDSADVVVPSDADGLNESPMVSAWDRIRFRFRTQLAPDEESARYAATRELADRIRAEVMSMAGADIVDEPDSAFELERRLNERFGDEALIGLGVERVRLATVEVLGEEYRSADVAWVGRRSDLSGVARGIAEGIRVERRAPFIKVGFSAAALVIGLLAWLQVDWWLKGHWAPLTKSLFVILVGAVIGVIWSMRIHV